MLDAAIARRLDGHVPEPDANLLDQGLDSLRFMMVVDELAAAGIGVDVTAAMLEPTRVGLARALYEL